MAFKFVVLSALLAVASAGLISPIQPYVAPAVAYANKLHYANPAVDAVASTHQNVVRSFGGTVSHHSKTVDTPYSSVHKEDTRVSNNVYAPAIAKTLTYAAPAPTESVYYTHATPVHSQTAVYATPAPTTSYSHYQQHQEATPTAYTHVETAAPTAAVYTHSTPVVTKTVNYAAPAPTAAVYTHSTPVITKTVNYAAPAPTAYVYQHQQQAPAAHVYQQQAPVAHVYQQQAPVTHIYHKEAPATHVYQHEAPTTTTTTYNHGPAARTYSHNAPGIAAYGSSQTVHYSPAEQVSHMSFDGFGTHWGF